MKTTQTTHVADESVTVSQERKPVEVLASLPKVAEWVPYQEECGQKMEINTRTGEIRYAQ